MKGSGVRDPTSALSEPKQVGNFGPGIRPRSRPPGRSSDPAPVRVPASALVVVSQAGRKLRAGLPGRNFMLCMKRYVSAAKPSPRDPESASIGQGKAQAFPIA